MSTLMTLQQHVDEDKFIARAMEGDDLAFQQVVEAFQGPVFNLCYRMLGDAQEAEDAAQETFLKAYRNMKRYDPEKKFVNWIYLSVLHLKQKSIKHFLKFQAKLLFYCIKNQNKFVA